MAITIGNTSSSGNFNNVNTTYQWSHTTHADTDCLVVAVAGYDNAAGDADVTGITFNGTALTNEVQYYDAAYDYNIEVWYLTETTYGADLGGVNANIVVTHGGKCSSACGFAVDLISVDQADPTQANNSETDAAAASGSITVAGAVAGSMTVGGMGCNEGDPAQTSVTAGTQIGETDQGGTVAGAAYRSGNGTLTWTDAAGAVDWVMAAVDFNEGAGTVTGIAALAGTGNASIIGLVIKFAVAAASGTGTLSAVGTPTRHGIAALAGTGNLSAVGTVGGDILGVAALVGIGTLSAVGTPTRHGVALLTGTGALLATGTPTRHGAALLTGTGSLSAVGLLEVNAAALLTGTGALSAIGTTGAEVTGVALLQGTGALSATGLLEANGAALLPGTGALTASGLLQAMGTALLTGTGNLGAVCLLTAIAAAILTGQGDLSAVGSTGNIVNGIALLEGEGLLWACARLSWRNQFCRVQQEAFRTQVAGRQVGTRKKRW